MQTAAIRERVVAMLANVADELAEKVAEGLGMPAVPPALPKAIEPRKPEVKASDTLSLFARPGDGSIRARRVAILVADGVDGSVRDLQADLLERGAVPRFVGVRLGRVLTADDEAIEVDVTLEAAPSVLFDAVAIPDGQSAIQALSTVGHALEFVKDQYRHYKPILAVGAASELLAKAGIPPALPSGKKGPRVARPDGRARGAGELRCGGRQAQALRAPLGSAAGLTRRCGH